MHINYFYKTFSNMIQYKMITDATSRLLESDVYWGPINNKDCEKLFKNQEPGTFLVRDSTKPNYLFVLVLKTEKGIKSIRIECDENSFFLQSKQKHAVPHFKCVLDLIEHYMKIQPGKTVYCVTSEDREPIDLIKPLPNKLSSLQHMCRISINAEPSLCPNLERIPKSIGDYLQSYKHSI